ncbi:uncharacterized protein G2W53_022352 [Senna tora]|uniref:Uncharacterized protein n=1 Tax=Senna tora TaxID=362788 RepID=A0A834WKE4_9FABA|nr:uncharacterized protein G2W53_022352 [Senna tora]
MEEYGDRLKKKEAQKVELVAVLKGRSLGIRWVLCLLGSLECHFRWVKVTSVIGRVRKFVMG